MVDMKTMRDAAVPSWEHCYLITFPYAEISGLNTRNTVSKIVPSREHAQA